MSATHHGILIHVVFSTRFRRPLIRDLWRDELFAFMGGVAKEHKATILQSGGIEDHVHLLVKIHPSFAIADTIKHIKANSSRWINAQHKTRQRFEWQRGYAAFSVSPGMSDSVKQYLANQQRHHQKQDFREEYLQILRRHGIAYDERYVFDKEVIT
ncbi:MAG: IS200/IS605 family transposase [Planctomycetales bacterium]|nr:IS200/IS605 family transposase [Planctomycetales bacterium]NIP68817.1 IS200/IS605 family transposase [Planctomycetales bacterium]